MPNNSHTVSGSNTRVQMEDFRCGGAGVAFSDQNDGGPGSGSYRSDAGSEGPDLENTSDSGGGYNVGWTRDGEWIEYEINAPSTDSYAFIIRYASTNGNNPQLQIRTTSVDYGYQENTGTISVGTTGGWQNWANHTAVVTLFQGKNIVRFNITNDNGNFNYFDIQPFTPTATPTPITPTATTPPTNTPVPTNTPAPVTITLYSNSSHDGYVRETNRTSNVGGNTNTNLDTIYVGDDGSRRQHIGFISFDTSSIPTNATIVSVQLRLRQQSTSRTPFGDNGLGSLFADIATFNGFSGDYGLVSGDFQAPAASNNVILLPEPSGDGAWSEGNMNAGFFGLINRDDFTQFKIHFESGDDGDNRTDMFYFYSGNSGQGSRPELIITYVVP
ncbi:MAG: carbohydrate-binding protein [Candidatus Promineifilaceae bacterium]|nr:carbohydrate-binding protein [Anaerolineaceae bacterium]